MKFEAINPFGKTVMNTEYEECVPDKEQIESMLKVGYKFKRDGKMLNKKELSNFLIHTGRNK